MEIVLPGLIVLIGVLYGGLQDLGFTLKQKDIYRVPTNISYVVPSHYVVHSLMEMAKDSKIVLPPDTLSLDEMLASFKRVNVLEEGRKWQIKKVDPQAEAARVSALTRLQPRDQ